MAEERHVVGQECQATGVLPLPDAWQPPDGEAMPAGDPEEAAALRRDDLHTFPCPHGVAVQVRITIDI